MRVLFGVVCSVLVAICPSSAIGQTVLLEAEGFDNHGGWVVDQQFMDQMGSPFLMAHGLGEPVEDATTTVRFPAAGEYRVLVRTWDWVSPWKAAGAPGKFELIVGGKTVETVFGTKGSEWHWQDGGKINVPAGEVQLAIHDLTGFNGRCDAIVFTRDDDFSPPNADPEMVEFRRQMLGLPDKPVEAGEFDLVVVGGGMAGTCSAVSAARLGVKVALIQNRPVLGGNNSSEVRVHLGGKINQEPYTALGNLVREIGPRRQGNARPADYYEDQKKLDVVGQEENLHLFLSTHVFDVEMEDGRILAVLARDVKSSRELRFRAPLFVDCTGDGNLGHMAGADFRMGREGHGETGEGLAPEEADKMTMGSSVQWYSLEEEEPVGFPECPWAVQFNDVNYQRVTMGEWNWETGMNLDQIEDFERVRDYGLRVVFGNWDFLKNESDEQDEIAKRKLSWVAYVAGKRESRRLLGDVILQEQDIREQKEFPDASVTTTWTIDLHYPDPENTRHFPGREFRSIAVHERIKPYPIPYRCFYSRNVPNLMMAGRNISVTHVALGTVRVMRTTGMMGEVVGMAASICKKHQTGPRDVYDRYLPELRELMTKGVGAPPPPPVVSEPPEWLSSAGENFARSAKLTVSGQYPKADYPVSNINDGKINVLSNAGRWVSNSESPGWVEMSWDEPVSVNAVRIVTGQAHDPEPTTPIIDFVLQSHDGTGWKDIPGTEVGANERFDLNVVFKPVTTRKFRLYVTYTPGGLMRIWEMELYKIK